MGLSVGTKGRLELIRGGEITDGLVGLEVGIAVGVRSSLLCRERIYLEVELGEVV